MILFISYVSGPNTILTQSGEFPGNHGADVPSARADDTARLGSPGGQCGGGHGGILSDISHQSSDCFGAIPTRSVVEIDCFYLVLLKKLIIYRCE